MLLHVHHHVKCGCFHSGRGLVYLKEILNESCREASKTFVMRSHSVLRALKNRQAKFGSKFILKCQRKHQSKLGVTERIRYENYLSPLFL